MGRKLNCVLLVDDDEGHNYLNRAAVEKSAVAAHVRTAWNGRDALDYLDGRGEYGASDNPRPDLILLDINMPVMDGWDFMREYGKFEAARKRGIMVVMLTTSVNPDDRARARTIPDIADFRVKPLTPRELEEVVRRYFEERA